MADLLTPKPLPGVTPGTPVSPTQPKPPKDNKNKPDPIQGGAGGVVGILSNPTNPLAPITAPFEVFNKLSNVYLWKRIGIVAIGVLLIWWAILIFLATNKRIGGAIQNTAKGIISKTPQGAAANVITGSVGA